MGADTLALLGGNAVRPEGQKPYNMIGERERQAVLDVLDSGELSGFVASPDDGFWGGRYVRELEAQFKSHFDSQHAVAVNSATSALHCAVSALGVEPGDEVIVTPYTMSASATAIIMAGGTPVFADIEEETYGLDPVSVEANISERTRGIMAVNIFGHPARLLPLRQIADKHGLFLIEDNAQAPDARYHNRKTGTIGDCGVFSLNRHKVMQSGEGGVLITDKPDVAMRAALMRNHGEVVVEGMGVEDIASTVGLNLRMTEMEAAVATIQFERLPELNDWRCRNAEYLSKRLGEIEWLAPPAVAEGCSHVYYLYCMKYNEAVAGIPRDLFCRAMNAEGFYVRSGYIKPVYLEPMYQQRIAMGRGGFPFTANPRIDDISYAPGLCPTVERMEFSELILTTVFLPPSDKSDIDKFIDAIKKIANNKDSLVSMAEKDAVC
jgi:perosamine synthetase